MLLSVYIVYFYRYPTREEVERSNLNRLNSLPGEERVFIATDTGQKLLMKSCIAPEKLVLKVKAQVMLLKNIDSTLVNGSLGTVIGFAGDKGFKERHELSPYRNFGSPSKNGNKNNRTEDQDFYDNALMERLPIVEFTNGRRLVIEQERWELEERGKLPCYHRRMMGPLLLIIRISTVR